MRRDEVTGEQGAQTAQTAWAGSLGKGAAPVEEQGVRTAQTACAPSCRRPRCRREQTAWAAPVDGGSGNSGNGGNSSSNNNQAGSLPAKATAKKPLVSASILTATVLLCALGAAIFAGDVDSMDLSALLTPPSPEHFFGTDSLGHDLFKMILHGGLLSLVIGLFSAAIAAVIAILYGTISALAPKYIDELMMRLVELILSLPSILIVVVALAALGKPSLLTISVVIGATSWMAIAKIVRTEVRQMRFGEFVLSARLSKAKLPYILRVHLLPNVLPSIMFMLIYNISVAIATEATLSFLGMGLPPGTGTWGSLMSLAEGALLSNSWWIIAIPSAFLITTLVCITNIGEYLRARAASLSSDMFG